VKDDENRIIQVVHMAQDITLRRQAEDARLREQELGRISAERQLVETQLRMLQAQIEPHFLFNTLAHIISLIQTEPESASKMLQYFTETLRVSLLRTREETSILRHEVDLLRNFLRIHAMRLESRLQFTIDIPEDVFGLPFPPLLLQPLVENAVIHGIEPKLEGGSIAITAERTADFLRLRVTDTGRGLFTATSNGVGLANVQDRLHALYGRKARLILTENIPCGTTATIEVPL
jgi:sensor histidine kinase YesM